MGGQVTGFITKEIHLQHFLPLQSSDRHRPGLSPSERTGPGFSAFKASADRPAQKNATSDIISSQPIACPTRKVGSAFFRTHVYFDSSPCFAHPTLLSVVGFFVDSQNAVTCQLCVTQRTRPLMSPPINQSCVFPTSKLVT